MRDEPVARVQVPNGSLITTLQKVLVHRDSRTVVMEVEIR
jgi:hypothetical protein